MKKLYLTILFCLCLLTALPFPHIFACGTSTPAYTHFVYMFGHANCLHWLVNSWTLLVLHNVIKPHRLIASYLLAVLTSYLHSQFSILLLPSPIGEGAGERLPIPTLGLSVITAFFLGFIALYLRRTNRFAFYATIALLIIGVFLPHIAGISHLLMFLSGLIYYKAEALIRSISSFINC